MRKAPSQQRYAFLLAYNGGPFAGWQMQPGRETVQETIGNALLALGLPPTVNGASRTDRGVHARAMVCSTSSHLPRDPVALRSAIRGVLHESIRLRAIAPVPKDFHAQFASAGKTYRYRLWLAHEPGLATLSWRMPSEEAPPDWVQRFSMGRLVAALEAMRGTRSFAGAMAGSAKPGLCELSEARVVRQRDSVQGRELTLAFRANRFGKYMIRTLVGIAVRCAVGELEVATLARRLDAEEPLTQLLAPPEGLALWKVLYRNAVDPFPWLTP